MQTVLITGANGFVGYYVTGQLLTGGYRVIATGKGDSRLPFDHDKLIYEVLDFTSREAVQQIFGKYRPDIVLHSGALSKPDECELNRETAFRTNVTGTLYLLEAAARCRSFFLFMSTDFVFEGKKLDYTEEDSLNPVNYYGVTKMLAEEAVKKYSCGWSIVRTILVYGHPKSGRQNILTSVAAALKKGEEPKIFDDQSRMPTYVEDLAGALVTIIRKKAAGIFHISGQDIRTPYQMACAVADHLGLPREKIHQVTADTFQQPAKRPPVTGFNLSKAERELDYTPTPFSEGLKKTFAD